MIQSIQQFQTEGVKNLEKVFINYSADMTKIAEMVKGVTDSVIRLGLSMIEEELEMYDTFLRENKQARSEWYIERRDKTTLLTSLGMYIPAKQDIRPGGTGCCSASNCTLTVQYSF